MQENKIYNRIFKRTYATSEDARLLNFGDRTGSEVSRQPSPRLVARPRAVPTSQLSSLLPSSRDNPYKSVAIYVNAEIMCTEIRSCLPLGIES